jgi:hypothetical protein
MSITTYKTILKIKLLKTNLKLHFILRQHDCGRLFNMHLTDRTDLDCLSQVVMNDAGRS